MFQVRTILHPTDFSERSGYAFQVACSLARSQNARVVVLHVCPPVVFNFGEGAATTTLQQEKEKLRERLLRIQPLYPDVYLEHRLEEGGPAEEILRVAKQISCDLIVMGTHGRQGLHRVLMGSVAEQVLREAPCPTLAVRAPLPAAQAPEKTAEEAEVIL